MLPLISRPDREHHSFVSDVSSEVSVARTSEDPTSANNCPRDLLPVPPFAPPLTFFFCSAVNSCSACDRSSVFVLRPDSFFAIGVGSFQLSIRVLQERRIQPCRGRRLTQTHAL